MNSVKTFVTRLFKDEGGAGMVEYALLACLIGVLLIGVLIALTGGVNNAMGTAVTGLELGECPRELVGEPSGKILCPPGEAAGKQ